MENQEKRKTTKNYDFYCLDKEYKSFTNLINYVNEQQDFYNGNQYPNVNYNNMIRVTLNICSFSANIKASKICGTPIYLTFTADDLNVDTTKVRQFDEYNCNKLKLKSHNFQAALNGFVNGTEITYIAWDSDDTSYKGIYKGGLREHHIDLRNFAVANPYISDIQNQKWVMFWDDYDIYAVYDMIEGKDKAEIQAKKDLIKREEMNDDQYQKKDSISHPLIRVYTRFFRIDGEVYFDCETEVCSLFNNPHPLSRKVSEALIKRRVKEFKNKYNKPKIEDNEWDLVKDYKIDVENFVMNEVKKEKLDDTGYNQIKEKFSLYPFAVYRPYNQNRSFYGRSDIKSLIPIQKGINFAISMNLQCAQNNAYNKIIAKAGALKGQKITNEPSQVIIDYSNFTNGFGVKFAESQPMPNGLLDFTDKLIGITRTIYSFSDVMNGDFSNKDISGYAVQQMIKQNNTTIEQQQQLFWVYNEDKAAIRMMYYKHYVDKARYTYEMNDADYDGEENARKILQEGVENGHQLQQNPNAQASDFATPTHKVKVEEIKSDELYGINFDISIEAMQGVSDSKLVEQQMWDNLLLNGGINNIDPDILAMYLEASPTISPRSKAALKRVVENRKKSQLYQLTEQFKQLAGQTQEIVNYAKQLESVNAYQGKYLKNLQTEFGNKINAQNNIINAFMKDKQNAEKDKMSNVPQQPQS